MSELTLLTVFATAHVTPVLLVTCTIFLISGIRSLRRWVREDNKEILDLVGSGAAVVSGSCLGVGILISATLMNACDESSLFFSARLCDSQADSASRIVGYLTFGGAICGFVALLLGIKRMTLQR